jgi:radical SAM superfamily enzyme YgiQ (UPF0313 family)
LPERVCLVIPPSAFLLDERVFVSLGVLRVAAVLEQAGVRVEMVDLSGVENYGEVIEAHAAASDARVFGLTATTPQLPAARQVVDRIRAARPDVRVILGGPHATLVSSARKLEARQGRRGRAHAAFRTLLSLFDVVVSGDGEDAVFRALDPHSPPLVDGDDPQGGLFMSDARYDASPLPARHLVDLDSYHYAIDGHRATSVIAQLGCPFGCGFCGGRNSNALRQIRTRSTASILHELEVLHWTYGYTGFMFYDDEMNVNKGLVELMNGIADLQARLGVEFRLRGFVKSQLFTDAQAAALHRAGFRWILVGFEAASPRILANINKRATRDDNTRCLEIARRHGLRVKALMSLGHPGESPETARELADWLLEVRPDDFDCTIITTYPGTPYYDEALPHPGEPGVYTYTAPKSGDRLHAYDVDFSRVADYYKGDPNGGYRAFVFTDALTSEALVEARDGIEREVRTRLGIPFNPSRAAVRYEHTMGMPGPLSDGILRVSPAEAAGAPDLDEAVSPAGLR